MKRRDFILSLSSIPILGTLAARAPIQINKTLSNRKVNPHKLLNIQNFDVMGERLLPPTGDKNNRIRIGLIGNGWRGESLMNSFGFFHPDYVKEMKSSDIYERWLAYQKRHENLFVDFVGIYDTFEVHAKRGMDVAKTNIREDRFLSNIKKYKSYQELINSKEIDAIIISTPDHSHAQIAIEAAKAGKHIYLEKPMCQTIEQAIELKRAVNNSNVIFQVGHENRQQMSYKLGKELYNKGVLGDISMIQTYTNRNTDFGAWIRERDYDHLGTTSTIDWEAFLCNAPKRQFDKDRYFNWQRYNDYGTGMIGNDFSHTYDCVNQVLDLGIPEQVMAIGGHFYFNVGKDDMADVFNAVFYYPSRKLTMTYDGTLKNSIYRQTKILGTEATMDIDRSILLYKDPNSERFKHIEDSDEPFYYYEPNARVDVEVDAVSSATAKSYYKSGYGPTYINGKVIDATFLHLKEWIDAIRGHGEVSCGIKEGFEETVTFAMANLSHLHKKPIYWDKENEKYIIG